MAEIKYVTVTFTLKQAKELAELSYANWNEPIKSALKKVRLGYEVITKINAERK